MTDQNQGRSPFEECVLLDLSLGRWGLTRKVASGEVDVSAGEEKVSPQAIRLSKRLLACEQYDAIATADGEVRRKIAEVCLPFRRGLHAVPLKLVDRVVSILNEYQQERRPLLVAAFMGAYAQAVRDAKEALGPLFRPDDYPDGEAIQGEFTVRWTFVELGTPGKLRAISKRLYAQEAEKARAQWAEAADSMQAAMREAFVQLVTSLRERLDGKRDDGKPKIFRDSRVTGLQEWLGLFEARNVTDDGELATLARKAKDLLSGVTADTLRRRSDMRAEVANGLKSIEQACSTLVVGEAPRRRFRFDE